MNQATTEISDLSFLPQYISSRKFSSVWVVADTHTARHCYPHLIHYLPQHGVIVIEAGEANKTLASCEHIWTTLTQARADRNALLINVGGGMVGDLGGFAAATYKRGIAFIQVPTTLLAMVDAAVGGKTGIDFMGFKNQIGVFQQPEAVLIHPPFLATLPLRQLNAGFAEVIKHYLIADGSAFYSLKPVQSYTDAHWQTLVQRNIAIKSAIVAQDPTETGIRKALNFGHTIGHALESYWLNDEHNSLLHGEAVAAGIICESYLSHKLNQLTTQELSAIVTYIKANYSLPALLPGDVAPVIELTKQDKKNEGAKILFTLLSGIGNYSINISVEQNMIEESLHFYNEQLL